jgi:hypothetical protein
MDDVQSQLPPGLRSSDPVSSVRDVSAASRYFAAAAYHDSKFRHAVLNFVRHGWYRARAPEFGIDEALVTMHCRRAERRERLRDLLMVVVFLLIAYEPIGWILSYPDETGQIVGDYNGTLILALLATGLVLFVERLITEHFTTARQFAREMHAAPESNEAAQSSQNLVVYGGYSPFVGSGYNVGGWSFSVNLERTRDDMGVVANAVPFAGSDLLHFVASRQERLRIHGLRHEDVLFADGKLVRDNARDLMEDGHPRRRIAAETIERLTDSPGNGTRAYLCTNIVDWSGELVLSTYLRCKKGESNLFLEASYFLLAPPKRSFFRIDEADPRLRIGTISRILSRSLILSWFVLIGAALRLIAAVQAPIAHWAERRSIRRRMRRNPRFNVGAVTSIRELGMENYYRVYFQQLDKEQHVKTVEQCTIDAIIEFLGAHNIDTSDIKDRRSTILNNGVIVSGGTLNADAMSVGDNAKAILARFGAKVGMGAAAGSGGGPAGPQAQPARSAP